MTENKRFDYEYVDDKFYDKGFFLDNGKRMFKDEVLNTLNDLTEENGQLKSFKDRVFNLFADEIKKENELLDYYIEEKAPYNAARQQIIIGVLKRLQKELEE